jgi:hypothetical protein
MSASLSVVDSLRPTLLLLLLVACPSFSACSEPTAYDQVRNRRYLSTTEGEVGLGPDGQEVYGSWEIDFVREEVTSLTGETRERDGWSRQLSDYYEAGEFRCDEPGVLLLEDYEGQEQYRAVYDEEADSLELEGKTYVFEEEL